MYAQARCTHGAIAVPIGVPVRASTLCLARRSLRSSPLVARAAAPVAPEQPPSLKSSDSDSEASSSSGGRRAFPYPQPMDPQQRALAAIPLALFYPGCLAVVAGAAYLGLLGGRAAPVDPDVKGIAAASLAAVAGGAAAAAAAQAKKKRDSASVVELYNTIVDLDDPGQLTSHMVADVGRRYGVNLQKAELSGLCKIYGQMLESVIPAGEVQLRGDEAPKVAAFKEALGLGDEDAAPQHIEVARRLFRQSTETKDRQQQFEQRKAFQRLIYVSQLVFGDQKAAFLLPWRRHFNLTEAQIFVARRDNAKAIFKNYLEQQGGQLPADRHFLRELRERQQAVKLFDETAAEVVKEYARKHIDGLLGKALDAIRVTAKLRDGNAVVEQVSATLSYCRRMASLANEEDLVPGLGGVTVSGGPLADPSKARDVREVYRTYLQEQMDRQGQVSQQLEADAKELQAILCLPSRDAQALQDEVAARLYKALLKEEVSSKRLDSAASPAQILQTLCDKVRFSPQAALDLHRSLYRAKVESLLDKRRFTDEDAAELKRIRRILCIPNDQAKKVMRETAGKLLEEELADIFLMGAKPLGELEAERVEKLMKELRMDVDVAVEVLGSVAREKLRAYVSQAQKERGDRKASVAHIKKMVQFNALVVTPILEKIKGSATADAMKNIGEMLSKAAEGAKKDAPAEPAPNAANAIIDVDASDVSDATTPSSSSASPALLPPPEKSAEEAKAESVGQMKKALAANRGEFGDDERRGQKEINLRQDLEQPMRAEIYKNYLMHTMMGDVVELPVGGAIRRKTNNQTRQAEMSRLQQLADLLGMDQMEVMKTQQDLAEQAYKAQATEALRTGPMTEEKAAYLADLRAQLGISQEAGDRVLKGVKQEVFGSAAAQELDGKWTIERVLEVTKAGGTVDGMLEEVTRRNLFRKELERKISDGQGDLDPQWILTDLPKALALEERKIQYIVKEMVATRKRMLLVQAVSQQRQRRPQEALASLQNLLSCVRVSPDTASLEWKEAEDRKDLFALFCSQESDSAKRSALQGLLRLDDEAVASITGGAEGGKPPKAKGEEEDFF